MKCIYCLADSRKKDRADGTCPSCHKRIAFEPSAGGPSDLAFKAVIDRVSGNGRVHFDAENLYFETARAKWAKKFSPGCGTLFAFGALVICGAVSSLWLVPVVVGVCAGIVYLAPKLRRTPQLTRVQFEGWFQQWKHAHGSPPGLIDLQPQPKLPAATIQQLESEIVQYSFDRAVICDRRETVDLLIANNFHFENNCAVLSLGGYPEPVFEIVRQMLKRNPKLQIFALHDASVRGCSMAYHLATDPQWFAGQSPIVDVGLRPAHARAFKGQWETVDPMEENPDGVTPQELSWLRHYRLSLSTVRPEQVIKRLFRAMSEQKEHGAAEKTSTALVRDGGGEVYHSDIVLFTSDASASDGGGDNFG